MTGSPTDHPILDFIGDALDDVTEQSYSRAVRESECIEFWDSEDGQWYEIVVRAIDEPSRFDRTA